MKKDITNLKLLLVDDEEDFRRATSKILNRRGFTVSEAADGKEALLAIKQDRPDIVLLDLKMPGLDGIETLELIRERDKTLPVIILTGHGDVHDAFEGIKLEIVDFLQKPFDIEQLSIRIKTLLQPGAKLPLRERTIAELMKPVTLYPRLYLDEPVTRALDALQTAFFEPGSDVEPTRKVRSALVYDRNEKFLGILRFPDLLKLVMPLFMDEEYASFFTGMFLAQCKLVGRKEIKHLMGKLITVNVHAPLLEAVHLMIEYHLINLPVIMNGELIGILREQDIILEIVNNIIATDQNL
ncbi:MAG: response regulator [Candidatus Electryonea clarkiae]|nr:response regulator [Candidatus Electryonea clarkiae]MDP8285972.1 response regulator [Candidatus Electryonea clarkiae]